MFQSVLPYFLYALIALLCLFGLLLSAVSISGTWLVAAAALVALAIPEQTAVGWRLVVGYGLLSALVEGAEALAGAWGVRRRGGSRTAGWAALVGGIFGLLLGVFIPIPLIGSLIGMLAGSFGLVYWVERRRLRQGDQATHIAMGAVIGRLMVTMLKVVVTLGMIVWLVVEL